jgi:hypothetical protein
MDEGLHATIVVQDGRNLMGSAGWSYHSHNKDNQFLTGGCSRRNSSVLGRVCSRGERHSSGTDRQSGTTGDWWKIVSFPTSPTVPASRRRIPGRSSTPILRVADGLIFGQRTFVSNKTQADNPVNYNRNDA